jgi:hypothetical protein
VVLNTSDSLAAGIDEARAEQAAFWGTHDELTRERRAVRAAWRAENVEGVVMTSAVHEQIAALSAALLPGDRVCFGCCIGWRASQWGLRCPRCGRMSVRGPGDADTGR